MFRIILFIKSIIPKIHHFCRLQGNILHALNYLYLHLFTLTKDEKLCINQIRGKQNYKCILED